MTSLSAVSPEETKQIAKLKQQILHLHKDLRRMDLERLFACREREELRKSRDQLAFDANFIDDSCEDMAESFCHWKHFEDSDTTIDLEEEIRECDTSFYTTKEDSKLPLCFSHLKIAHSSDGKCSYRRCDKHILGKEEGFGFGCCRTHYDQERDLALKKAAKRHKIRQLKRQRRAQETLDTVSS